MDGKLYRVEPPGPWPAPPPPQVDGIEVRRGFGEIELSTLAEDEFVTASGLGDGGYIVWKKRSEP